MEKLEEKFEKPKLGKIIIEETNIGNPQKAEWVSYWTNSPKPYPPAMPKVPVNYEKVKYRK